MLIFLVSVSVTAQETTPIPKKGTIRPDIPGTFSIEIGINQSFNKPDTAVFGLGLWGSRAFNLYYQLDKRIGKSKFSFHPGIGFGLERYKFKKAVTLIPGTGVDEGNTVFTESTPRTKKTMVITNYLEIPLELRFSANPDDPTRSFKVSFGAKAGYLFDAHTKVKYRVDGQNKILKSKQNFNFTDLRYSAFLKFGIGNFQLFGQYNLVPLFKDLKGPLQTDMSMATFGISLSSF